MIPEARTWNERCSGCGFHVATQGCACNGTLKFALVVKATDADEWAVFTAALVSAAKDGRVHQADVRPHIRGRIEPKHIGTLYRRARAEGLIREVDHERSDDIAGKNAGRLEPVYELRGAA